MFFQPKREAFLAVTPYHAQTVQVAHEDHHFPEMEMPENIKTFKQLMIGFASSVNYFE